MTNDKSSHTNPMYVAPIVEGEAFKTHFSGVTSSFVYNPETFNYEQVPFGTPNAIEVPNGILWHGFYRGIEHGRSKKLSFVEAQPRLTVVEQVGPKTLEDQGWSRIGLTARI